MPLPDGGSTPWPPEDCKSHLDDCRAWAAWWSGDVTELMATSGLDDVDGITKERRFNMGPTARRRFWQRRNTPQDATSAVRAVHAPLAADIAETSADLLFGEPPDLTVESPPMPPPNLGPAPDPIVDPAGFATFDAQKQLLDADHATAVTKQREQDATVQSAVEQVVEETQLWSRLLEGAESCSAVGGVYLRPAWDTGLAQHPLSSVVDQTHAVPDFKWGRLVAVTFWEEVLREGGKVWRHLERHEPAVILHGLYQGTADLLGDKVGLEAHPSTAGFLDTVPLPAGLPRDLIVTYVPNVLPNRHHRSQPVGRADISGSESFLDALDETWSSWMRDLRLGQAKLIVPDEFLTPAGLRPNEGRTLDLDRELFTGLSIAEIEKISDPIKLIQPDLRVEAHAETMMKLVGAIVSAAGYSPQTFGLEIEGQAESGTALRIREKKTLQTRRRKQGYWTPAIVDHVENLMALDAALFSGPAPVRPRVDWPDLTDDPAERATTTAAWHTAQAVSLWERVKARNPHWDEQQIQAEVDRIEGEKAAAMPMLDLPPTDPGDESGTDKGDEPTATPFGIAPAAEPGPPK